jgi:hypothetical protein
VRAVPPPARIAAFAVVAVLRYALAPFCGARPVVAAVLAPSLIGISQLKFSMAVIAFAMNAAHPVAFAAARMLHLEIVECKSGYISAQPAPRLDPCAGLTAIELPKLIRLAQASQHALPVTADRANWKERRLAAVAPCARGLAVRRPFDHS